MTVTALSIRNPLSYLVCAGLKDVENRSWSTEFRERAAGRVAFRNAAIVGSVEIVEVLEKCDSPWRSAERYAWVLRNPVLFDEPFTGVKGKLRFFEVEETDAQKSWKRCRLPCGRRLPKSGQAPIRKVAARNRFSSMRPRQAAP